MKIIHIITRMDKGGSADIVLKLSEEMKRRGYDVSILSGLTKDPVTDIEGFIKRTGIKIKFIPYLRRDIEPLNDIRSLLFITGYLLKEKPLIVHLHTSKAGFIGRLAGKLAGVKCIVYSTHGHIFYGYFGRFRTWFFIVLERFAGHFCDAIITLSRKEKGEFLSLKIAKEERIIHVPNGLDISLFSEAKDGVLRSELGIDKNTTIIGWIGRFEQVKSPDIFLSICKKLSITVDNTVAVMVGDGSLFPAIRQKIINSGLEKFLLLLGYRNDINLFLKDMDIFVLTSLNEGQGLVIMEAMAAGKPVVAHNVGGIGEIVDDGMTGYLVTSGDIDTMAEHIRNLIIDKEARNILGTNGYSKVKRYTFTEMVTRFEEIYTMVLSRKNLQIT